MSLSTSIDTLGSEVPEGNISAGAQQASGNDKKFRHMWFTWYRTEDPPCWNPKIMDYLAYGLETCPTTGRKHFQGHVWWKNQRYVKAVSKAYSCTFGDCVGTTKQNDEYCGKESPIQRFGKAPAQGERTDLKSYVASIMRGEVTVDEIMEENPMLFHQYGRTLNAAEDKYLRKQYRTEMTTCDWYYGPTGVGKSHIALSDYDPNTVYKYRNDNGWWEGYKQQPTVVINEFRGEIKYSELLELIDKWPYHVKRRNREPMPFTSTHIIITSCHPPDEVYKNLARDDSIDQLLRRIKVYHIPEKGAAPKLEE